jgi:hypothetical protein
MNWETATTTGGLILVVLGLIEVIKIFARLIYKRVGNSHSNVKPTAPNQRGNSVVSKLDLLQIQNTIKQSIDERFRELRAEIKEAVTESRSLMEKHVDFWHRDEISQVRRNPLDP